MITRFEPLALDHRSRASRDLERDLAVTAGAGAGKTTVLVDRFVQIARDPKLGPERILAITFTRKAAVEMKERAIRVFEQAGEVDLRRQTEAAYISTIHGFAERVLRERPFDARIDPAFTVLTEYDQAIFLQQALQTMYARPDLRAFAPRLGKERVGGWRVFSLVRDVAQRMREGSAAVRTEAGVIGNDDACIALGLERAQAHVRRMEARMLAVLRMLHPLIDGATFKSRGSKYQQWQNYLEATRGCLAAASVSDPAAVWRATSFTSEIPPGEREPIRAFIDQIKKLAPDATYADWGAQEALERELLPLKRAIYAAADVITATYLAHKRRTGALDFHDLQHRTAALLRDNAAVRGEYADRFRHILLDEAQDTDELQYGIVESLRGSPARNTLFIVGDPKQAIYEFRGANPDVFHAALARLPEPDRLQLPENFRSRPEIVSFINGVGPSLLPDQFVQIVARADYGGQALGAVPAVTALYAVAQETSADGEKPRFEPIAELRPREAAAVAEEIVRLLREAPLVRDPDSREVRWTPLRPRHVAMLFRTRTAIPYFERALADRGVPYVTASGQGFYNRAEVLDCMMLLRVVAQPLDDLAMAAVLRSPFAGASDADLWRLRTLDGDTARRRPRALYYALGRYAPLAEFHTRLVELRRRTRGGRASEVLEDALRTFDYAAAVAAHQDGPAMLGNLAKLRRQVRNFGAMSPLDAYLELERTRELMPQESTAALVGAADDVVVLTTIHQAKGLEWPIVCLPNLQASGSGTRTEFSARHGVVTCKPLDANGEVANLMSLAAICNELDQRAEAEERRLLYVALTRSRERLILSASVKPTQLVAKEEDAFRAPLSFLLRSTEGTLRDPGERDHDSYRTVVRHLNGAAAECTLFERSTPLARSITPRVVVAHAPERSIAAALPVSLKVTELLSYRRCPQVYRFSHTLDISENLPHRAVVRGTAESGLSPVELGTVVHAMLERVRFDAPDSAAEVTRLLDGARAEDIPALRRMLDGVINGEIGEAVRVAARVEREWSFAVRVGGVLMEGVIDLAIQAPDGRWTVLDYKSNDFSRTGRLDYLVDYYRPQLDLYALALSQSGLGVVSECALVFLNGPRVQRWAFDAEAGEIAHWSRETVERIAAEDYRTMAGPKCELCGYRKRKVCDIGRTWVAPAMAPSMDPNQPVF